MKKNLSLLLTLSLLSLSQFSVLAQDLNEDGSTNEETTGKKKKFNYGKTGKRLN